MEHEPTDPAQLDFDGSASAYDPPIQRDLSEVGEMGVDGPPPGPASASMGGGAAGPSARQEYNDFATVFGDLDYKFTMGDDPPVSYDIPVGALLELGGLIWDIFGGGEGPGIPWWKQVRLSRRAHPLYVLTIGMQEAQLGNGERFPAPAANGKAPSNQPPNQKPEYKRPQPPTAQQLQQQRPGCGAALAEFGAGVVGTALTAGAVGAAIYFAPELVAPEAGVEGLDALLHIGIPSIPGATLLELGAINVYQKCF